MLIAAASAVLGLGFNWLRADGVPLVAREPYQVLVPCPEPGGPVTPVAPSDPVLGTARTFLIDARGPTEYAARHREGAVNVPYDWLDPVPDAVLVELAHSIAASGATRVVVYGDGGRPDSGEHLGREISGRGIKNVCFVSGGAPALLEVGGP
jgi:hypothetical protein